MRNRRLILGIVRKVVRSRSIAQLQPLFEAAPDHSSWSREYSREEVIEEFPNRGIVSWLSVRPNLDEGSLWQFPVEDQEFEDDNPQHDAFRVAQGVCVAREVLDLRRYGTADEIRRLVTDGGISLNFLPSESVYLWVEDHHWIGPVHLHRNRSRWHLLPSQEAHPLPPLPLYKATTEISSLNIGSPRIFLAPNAEPGVKLGSVDWSADAMVMKRVLTRLRKQDQKYSEVLQLTQKAIEHAQLMVGDSDRYLQEQQVQRAATVVASLRTNADRTKELLTELLDVPSVAKGIEQAKYEAVRDAKISFESEMAEEKERLKAVKNEIENEKKVLQGLEEEEANRREAIGQQVDVLGAEMEERLKAILEKPTKFLAEVGIFRAALGRVKGVEKNGTNEVKVADQTSGTRFGKSLLPFENWKVGTEVSEVKQVRLVLSASARSAGVQLPVVQSLHAAFLAGSVPVLYGADSYDVLSAYTSSIAGGRLLWLPISTGLLEASDLFGRSEPQAGRFLPRPGGLADVMREAAKLRGLVIVALDGLNRSAVDAYLSPVIDCYTDAQKGATTRRLAITHPGLLAEDDPYASLATLIWPENVLLAGVLAGDVTTIPPSPEFWVHCPLISAEAGREGEIVGSKPSATAALSANGWTSVELWRELRRPLTRKESPEFRKGWSALADEELRLPLALREACQSFYEGMVNWPMEPKAALQKTIENAVVPYLVAKGLGERLLEVGAKAIADREALRRYVEVVEEALS